MAFTMAFIKIKNKHDIKISISCINDCLLFFHDFPKGILEEKPGV